MIWLTQLIVTALAFPAGRIADIHSSLDFPAYGRSEGNGWFDMPDGSLNLPRAVWVSFVVEAALLAAFFFIHETVAMLCSLLIGGGSFIHALINWGKKKTRRRDQIRILQERGWYGMGIITDKALRRSYYGYFPWIYSTEPDINAARDELNERLEVFRDNPVFPA